MHRSGARRLNKSERETDEKVLRVARAMCRSVALNCRFEGRASCRHVGRCISEFRPMDGLVREARAAIAELEHQT